LDCAAKILFPVYNLRFDPLSFQDQPTMGGVIMAAEFLVILFPRSRRVMINGEFMGTTNRKLELESGIYEVTLGPPLNFTPEKCDVDLRNTSSLMPMTVEFEEVES
jgi:hypothetical protein